MGTMCSAAPTGSSPLTRGKLGRFAYLIARLRLIPAHAGKTSCVWHSSMPRPAHPRSRGENLVPTQTHTGARGSSPLTRGKLGLPWDGPGRLRLIPAHAGKTFPGPVGRCDKGAHPRSRGENREEARVVVFGAGSSPLTRGKRRPPRRGHERTGLIPAHAGKTLDPRVRQAGRAAHPRSRGENGLCDLLETLGIGSSPLTRGKLESEDRTREVAGLIPAHAGKTLINRVSKLPPRAHPRSRGENAEDRQAALIKMGSSPLTRGKRSRRHKEVFARRLIPAHAGKT